MATEQEQFHSGAEIDTRPLEAKLKDFKFEELVSSVNPVVWVEKTPDKWRKFPIFNQNGSGSCVAQTEAKEMGIIRSLKDKNYVHFSATDIYQRRINKPAGGMGAVNARDIVKNGGATLESLVPSQSMTDEEMDSAIIEPYKREVGSIFKVSNYLEIPKGQFETIASIIQTTGKGVMVWFYFNSSEWGRLIPEVQDTGLQLESALRHSVTAVDFFLHNGIKVLRVEDSARFNGLKEHLITEQFFNARNWYAGYLMNFKFDDQQYSPAPISRPVHKFDRTLQFSPSFMIDSDVKFLQDILKYEGLFPANTTSTGYYGAITAKAVLAWQKKYKVDNETVLNELQGKVVGPKTRAKLNALYSV